MLHQVKDLFMGTDPIVVGFEVAIQGRALGLHGVHWKWAPVKLHVVNPEPLIKAG